MSIKITDFRNIRPLSAGKLRAFVDVVFNDALVVKGFKVVDGKNGLFVAVPSRKVEGKDGEPATWNDIVYFTKDSGLWGGIQEQILDHYKESIAETGSGDEF